MFVIPTPNLTFLAETTLCMDGCIRNQTRLYYNNIIIWTIIRFNEYFPGNFLQKYSIGFLNEFVFCELGTEEPKVSFIFCQEF